MEWINVGSTEELKKRLEAAAVIEVKAGTKLLAVTFKDGQFGAVSGVCNHVGGPLGKGTLDGEFIVCPWHYFKFHRVTGEGEPGYEADRVPKHDIKIENGNLFVSKDATSTRNKIPHPAHPLTRKENRASGPIRVLGISTTAMTEGQPRISTSSYVLEHALKSAAAEMGAETKLISLNDLKFRNCEGFYSKHSHACTWPCSITQIDPEDQLDRVYEAVVHWADVICISTPIRWGNASSLYYKMIERFNCVQNQITIKQNRLIKNKVACFVITGGQDNIQSVAGQMMTFFSELGFALPPFPFVAHSLGWTAENMEKNVNYVLKDEALKDGAREMICRAVTSAKLLIDAELKNLSTLGGRKGFDPMKNEEG